MRALFSLTDKSGSEYFALKLQELGYEILSTGGTAKHLSQNGVKVIDVSDVTGFPEMLDGRVKTLHPKIHGGLLGDVRLESHQKQLEEAGIKPISIVCVNLYAFEKTVTREHSAEDAIESIDIGGPAMIRAAAKNHANVLVIVDHADYDRVLEALNTGDLDRLKKELAAKAFRHTAFYDSMISRYLSQEGGAHTFTENLTMGFREVASLRYGENPHQKASLYVDPLVQGGIAQAMQYWGKELSYNNLLDSEAAWELACDLPQGACAIIKHGNPCGAAIESCLGDSYRQAKLSDPISSFGGIAAFHGAIDESAAEAMTEKGNFLEVVIGTSISEKALEIFKNRSGWGQNVRILTADLAGKEKFLSVRSIRGGALIQESDENPEHEWKVVTEKQPTEEEWKALKLGWSIIPHVKSNAIVVTSPRRLLGVGAGQMNRVQSVRLAIDQAGEGSKGSVLSSDAFFPFSDSIETAATFGVSVVVQPGGSKKDDEVIAKANELGLSMVFTGVRHFRH